MTSEISEPVRQGPRDTSEAIDVINRILGRFSALVAIGLLIGEASRCADGSPPSTYRLLVSAGMTVAGITCMLAGIATDVAKLASAARD